MENALKIINELNAVKMICAHRINIENDEIEKEMYADWVNIIDNAIGLIKKQNKEINILRPKAYAWNVHESGYER